MRGSIKMFLASIMMLVFSLRADVAAFIPQWIKIGVAVVLFIIGLVLLWREQQWRG